jgi:hypothetical protein
MTTSGKITFVSFCLLLAAIALPSAWVNRQSTEHIGMQTQTTMNSRLRLQAQIAMLKKQIAQAGTDLTKSSPNPVAGKVAHAAGEGPSNSSNQSAENPALVSLRKGYFRAQAQLDFGRFFQSAGLSSAQSEAVCDRIAEHEEWSQDHANEWPRNVPPSDPRFVAFQKQSDEEGSKYASDLRALLGGENIKAFSEFTSSQRLRQQVDNFASAVYATETPLSLQQSQQLAKALANHTSSRPGSARRLVDLALVTQEAQTFLSPLQLSILTKQLTAEKLWNDL